MVLLLLLLFEKANFHFVFETFVLFLTSCKKEKVLWIYLFFFCLFSLLKRCQTKMKRIKTINIHSCTIVCKSSMFNFFLAQCLGFVSAIESVFFLRIFYLFFFIHLPLAAAAVNRILANINCVNGVKTESRRQKAEISNVLIKIP